MKSLLLSGPLFGTLAHGLFAGTRTTTYTWTNLQQTVTAVQGGDYSNSILLGDGTSSVYASYGEVTTYFSKTVSIGTNGSVALVSTSLADYGVSSSMPASVSVPLGTGSSSMVAPTSSSSQYAAPSSSSSVDVPRSSSSSIVAYVPTSSSSIPLGASYPPSSSSTPDVFQSSVSSSVPLGTDSYSASRSSGSLSASVSGNSDILSSSSVPLGTGSQTLSQSYSASLSSASSNVPIGTGSQTLSNSDSASGDRSSSVPPGTGNQTLSHSNSASLSSASSVIPIGTGSQTFSSSYSASLGSGSSSVPLGTGSVSSSSVPITGSSSFSYNLSQRSTSASNSSVVVSTSSHTLSASISGSNSASVSASGSVSGSASNSGSVFGSASNGASASGSASNSGPASGRSSQSDSSSQAPSVSISSSAAAGGYPVVITVATTVNGQSTDVPMISGGSVMQSIAITPTTTYAPTDVTLSKSAVESQLSSIFPLIQGWLDDTDSDPTPVKQNLDDIESDVTNLLNGLEEGEDDSDGGCTSGLFSLFTCIIGDVTAITGGITGTITSSVISSITDTLADLTSLTSQIQDVKDNNDDDDHDDQSSSQSSGSTSASSSSASCSASAVAHTQVTCSPSPISQSGTIASYTQICSTDVQTITKCSASYSASTTTLSASTSSGTPLSMGQDFPGEEGGDISEQIYSELDAVFACITGFQLPMPTACPGLSDGSGSQNTTSASAGASSSGSSFIIGSSSGTITTGSTSASAGSSSSLSIPSSTSARSSSNSASISSSVSPSSSSPISTYSPTTAPPITRCALVTQPLTTIYSHVYPETLACSCNDGWVAGVGTLVGDDSATTYTCAVGTSTTMAVSTTTPPPAYATGTCNVHIFEASLGEDLELYVQLNLTDGGSNLLSSTEYEASWGDTMTLAGTDTKLPWDVIVDFTTSTQLSKKLRKRGASKRELFDILRRDPEYGELMRRDPELVEILRRDPLACIAKRNPIPQCGGGGSSPPDPYEEFEVSLEAGGSKWSSEDTDDSQTPYCSVGGWDNGDFGDFLDEVFSLGTEQQVPTRQMDCHFPC